MFAGFPKIEKFKDYTLQERHGWDTARFNIIGGKIRVFLIRLYSIPNANSITAFLGRSLIEKNIFYIRIIIPLIDIVAGREQLLAGGQGRVERFVTELLGDGNRPTETFGFRRKFHACKVNLETENLVLEADILFEMSFHCFFSLPRLWDA